MKPSITQVCEAIELTIKETLEAILRANGVDRMVERNLEMRLAQFEQQLRNFRDHEEYLLQERFRKFVIGKKEIVIV